MYEVIVSNCARCSSARRTGKRSASTSRTWTGCRWVPTWAHSWAIPQRLMAGGFSFRYTNLHD
jgi:hypothetical protein